MSNQWRKAISRERDGAQSRALVAVVGTVLLLAVPVVIFTAWTGSGAVRHLSWAALAVSSAFAVIVWGLRAGTLGAAVCGAAICFMVIFAGGLDAGGSVWRTGLSPLVALFALTFGATKAGRHRKEAAGLAEGRKGRNAAQVIANLGSAGLVALYGLAAGKAWTAVALVAILCESTADTVSSEVGQAFGGPPVLLTTFKRVPAGTDGAVSVLGTVAGVIGAVVVAGVGWWSLRLTYGAVMVALGGGVAGLVFDSLLGATVERRGWLGNDLVNFLSTVFAAGIAWLAMR